MRSSGFLRLSIGIADDPDDFVFVGHALSRKADLLPDRILPANQARAPAR